MHSCFHKISRRQKRSRTKCLLASPPQPRVNQQSKTVTEFVVVIFTLSVTCSISWQSVSFNRYRLFPTVGQNPINVFVAIFSFQVKTEEHFAAPSLQALVRSQRHIIRIQKNCVWCKRFLIRRPTLQSNFSTYRFKATALLMSSTLLE